MRDDLHESPFHRDREVEALFALVAERTNLDDLCFQLRRSPEEVRAKLTILAVGCSRHVQAQGEAEPHVAESVAA